MPASDLTSKERDAVVAAIRETMAASSPDQVLLRSALARAYAGKPPAYACWHSAFEIGARQVLRLAADGTG
jgi:hypothetical protein